jgi:hypothetical protein
MPISPEAAAKIQATRDELVQRHTEYDTVYWMQLDLDQVEDLAANCVPTAVRAMARLLLEDVDALLRKNAGRPVRRKRP